jgi:hypothetical protein
VVVDAGQARQGDAVAGQVRGEHQHPDAAAQQAQLPGNHSTAPQEGVGDLEVLGALVHLAHTGDCFVEELGNVSVVGQAQLLRGGGLLAEDDQGWSSTSTFRVFALLDSLVKNNSRVCLIPGFPALCSAWADAEHSVRGSMGGRLP